MSPDTIILNLSPLLILITILIVTGIFIYSKRETENMRLEEWRKLIKLQDEADKKRDEYLMCTGQLPRGGKYSSQNSARNKKRFEQSVHQEELRSTFGFFEGREFPSFEKDSVLDWVADMDDAKYYIGMSHGKLSWDQAMDMARNANESVENYLSQQIATGNKLPSGNLEQVLQDQIIKEYIDVLGSDVRTDQIPERYIRK